MKMNEMMKHCCGEGGMPDPAKMKEFMEKCGKKEFGEANLEMMQKFCCKEGMPDPKEMMEIMEKCGCRTPSGK